MAIHLIELVYSDGRFCMVRVTNEWAGRLSWIDDITVDNFRVFVGWLSNKISYLFETSFEYVC